MYNTIIKPHFEFGPTILYSSCSDNHIIKFQMLQNKAMRAKRKVNRVTSTDWIFLLIHLFKKNFAKE